MRSTAGGVTEIVMNFRHGGKRMNEKKDDKLADVLGFPLSETVNKVCCVPFDVS